MRAKTDFAGGFADAIRDIRQKVVEEPWFGRAVTETPASLNIWSTIKDEKDKAAAEKGEEAGKDKQVEADPTVPPAGGPEPDIEPEL